MADVLVVVQDEISVRNDKKALVAQAAERIRAIFKVEATFSSPESSGHQWVQLKGPQESIEKAKEYIKSLCNPEIKGAKVRFDERFYETIHNYGSHVERISGAVVLFASRSEAVIQGSEIAVVIASSSIEEHINELKAGLQHPFTENVTKERRNTPNVAAASAAPTINLTERTFEHVQGSPKTQAYIDPSLEEFAMKLGYTKEDIYQVVRKQGKEVDQNTLLHELIKVSTPMRPRQSEPMAFSGPGPAVIMKGRSDVVARGTPAAHPPPIARHIIPDSMPSYPKTVLEPQYMVSDRPPEEEAMIYQQVVAIKESSTKDSDLRHIVIDGSNVAMSHGNHRLFSCQGIKICVDWFKKRGHKEITVFVPQWRKETPRTESPMENQEILYELEREQHVVFTPSRRINGRRIVCYDDRFIVRLAAETDGIIVSNDNFRDLFDENPKWQEVIEQRILMYSFVGDIFMVPDDPLGRHGPTLNDFLRKGTVTHPRICPYLRRCTYGLRCKFYHPERDPARKLDTGADKAATTRYAMPDPAPRGGARDERVTRGYANAQQPMPRTIPARPGMPHQYNANPYGQYGMPMPYNGAAAGAVHPGMREGQRDIERHTQAATQRRNYDYPDGTNNSKLFNELKEMFPQKEETIDRIMRENPKADKQLLTGLIASCV